jgi:hypothetical protein
MHAKTSLARTGMNFERCNVVIMVISKFQFSKNCNWVICFLHLLQMSVMLFPVPAKIGHRERVGVWRLHNPFNKKRMVRESIRNQQHPIIALNQQYNLNIN